MLMRMRIVLFAALLTTSAQAADWNRDVRTIEGSFQDSPLPHHLSYFRVPCARSDPKDQFLHCDPATNLEFMRRLRTDLHEAGKVDGLTVYDLCYFLPNEDDKTGTDCKRRSILVKVAADAFREIRVDQVLGPISPTKAFRVGRQSILQIEFDIGDQHHMVFQDFLLLTRGGSERLDLSPIVEAAKGVIPIGSFLMFEDFDFKEMVYTAATENGGKNVGVTVGCCDGSVKVPFKVENGKPIPGEARYTPWF